MSGVDLLGVRDALGEVETVAYGEPCGRVGGVEADWWADACGFAQVGAGGDEYCDGGVEFRGPCRVAKRGPVAVECGGGWWVIRWYGDPAASATLINRGCVDQPW